LPMSMMRARAVQGKPAEHPRRTGGARMHGAVLPFRTLFGDALPAATPEWTPAGRVPAEEECKRLQFYPATVFNCASAGTGSQPRT
jgi:hypothetical protein